jgi:integrase
MIYTGLRIGELAKLTAQDCHIDDGYIICGEKTSAGRNRIVPLPPGIPELSDWLKQWAETTKKKTLVGLCVQRIRDDLFYPALLDLGMIDGTKRDTGGFLFPDKYHLTPHSCRHTFASMCAAAGMQPEQLQKIIGHANYQTTADIYIHNDLDTLRQAMSKLKR